MQSRLTGSGELRCPRYCYDQLAARAPIFRQYADGMVHDLASIQGPTQPQPPPSPAYHQDLTLQALASCFYDFSRGVCGVTSPGLELGCFARFSQPANKHPCSRPGGDR